MGSMKEKCRDVERNQRNYTPVSCVSDETTPSISQSRLQLSSNKNFLFTYFTIN